MKISDLPTTTALPGTFWVPGTDTASGKTEKFNLSSGFWHMQRYECTIVSANPNVTIETTSANPPMIRVDRVPFINHLLNGTTAPGVSGHFTFNGSELVTFENTSDTVQTIEFDTKYNGIPWAVSVSDEISGPITVGGLNAGTTIDLSGTNLKDEDVLFLFLKNHDLGITHWRFMAMYKNASGGLTTHRVMLLPNSSLSMRYPLAIGFIRYANVSNPV